ncbi:MAG: flagellar export protein FliJ [Candidatus Competibacteraceae bacterium]|nr:flagellar export protein FliJ [Candidatus Competibacteraceae bacterium]
MARKAHPLQAAVQVAQAREEEAAKRLTESQQRLAEQQHRVQQLMLFRGEYATQFQNEGGGISARRFRDYSAFLNNLDLGITQSRHQLERLQQEIQRRRQEWVQTHAKTKALEEVLARDLKACARREDQREQRDSDERNLRGSSARKADLEDGG